MARFFLEFFTLFHLSFTFFRLEVPFNKDPLQNQSEKALINLMSSMSSIKPNIDLLKNQS